MGNGCAIPVSDPMPINNATGTRLVRQGTDETSGSPPQIVNDGDCPTQLPNLPNQPVGEPGIEILGSGSAYGGPLRLLCPQNGEWQARKATCDASSTGSRDADYCGRGGNSGQFGGCCDGKCYIGTSGCTTKCVRLGYNADRLQCCLTGGPLIGDLTCDPVYRGSSKPDCQPLMKTHCDNETNFFTNSCKTWLRNISQTDRGTADELANKYCTTATGKTTQNAPFCACYNIQIPSDVKPSARGIFRCLDDTCSGNQQALNTLTCPNVYQDCSIKDINVVLNESTVNKINIANKCCVGDSCPPSGTISPSATPTSTPTPTTTSPTNYVVPVTIGAAILALVITILVIVMVLKKKK